MINPVNHALSADDVEIYKVEPYVIAADVYAVAPHIGRGGWSWYTGSAGWMYRLIVESLLGLVRDNSTLRFKPCLPADWPGFSIRYRFGETVYDIAVAQRPAGDGKAHGWTNILLDGIEQYDGRLALIDDGAVHRVDVVVHAAVSSTQ